MSAPPKWSSIDRIVQSQVERTRELDRRSREASAKAREASENIAAIERDDQRRRSDALAEGKRDPGRDADKIATAEREAQEAAEAATILADAYATARAKLDAVCDDRSEPWAAEARKRLERAAVELRAGAEVVASAYQRMERRRADRLSSQRASARGARAASLRTLRFPDLEAPGGNPILGSDVIAALAHVADPVEVESESQTMSAEARRTFVATGGQVTTIARSGD